MKNNIHPEGLETTIGHSLDNDDSFQKAKEKVREIVAFHENFIFIFLLFSFTS